MKHHRDLDDIWPTTHQQALVPSSQLPPITSRIIKTTLPGMVAVKIRDNELKCLLAAVISVINQIKITRSEEQKSLTGIAMTIEEQ